MNKGFQEVIVYRINNFDAIYPTSFRIYINLHPFKSNNYNFENKYLSVVLSFKIQK